MKKQKRDYIAKIVIYDLPNMGSYDKRRLIRWLEGTANNLAKENPNGFAKIYTLRLMMR